MGSGSCNRSQDGMTRVAWQLPSDKDNSTVYVGFIASLLVVVFFFGTLAMRPLLITTMSSCMRATSCTDKSVSLKQVFRAALSSEHDVVAATGVKSYCLMGPRHVAFQRGGCAVLITAARSPPPAYVYALDSRLPLTPINCSRRPCQICAPT